MRPSTERPNHDRLFNSTLDRCSRVFGPVSYCPWNEEEDGIRCDTASGAFACDCVCGRPVTDGIFVGDDMPSFTRSCEGCDCAGDGMEPIVNVGS